MNPLFLALPLILGLILPQGKSKYERLLDFEGKYEYLRESTLVISASAFDTTLYAVVNDAKYPLRHIAKDRFINVQETPVVFNRNAQGSVESYSINNQTFRLISTEIEKMEMFPRKELFKHPESFAYQVPELIDDGLPTGDLRQEFAKPELILDMIRKTIAGDFPDVHSVLIYKNNKLVLEEYFYGFDRDDAHQLRSATKPFIGGLLGMAIDQGLIAGENEKLLPFFQNKYQRIENMDSLKQEVTIAHFLGYRHGMDCENNNPQSIGNEQQMMQSDDWVKYTLDLPMIAQPGKASSYCTGCALVLGSLVEIATNQPIEDFARAHLFGPLGITNYDWTFEPNPQSILNFSQMSITPRDLVKLAKMYKDGGQWQGKQILSSRWVSKTFDTELGDYGYLWKSKYFVVDGKTYSSYMATGNGGQKINIWPELDMITVFTGGSYNSYQLYGKSSPPNEMIPNYILKAIE